MPSCPGCSAWSSPTPVHFCNSSHCCNFSMFADDGAAVLMMVLQRCWAAQVWCPACCVTWPLAWLAGNSRKPSCAGLSRRVTTWCSATPC
ncbi:hypothetical protein DUNSADRAFT_6330, partial [Dunaliella salina]